MNKLFSALVAFVRDEEGLTMVEYAVAGAMITAAAATAFENLGSAVGTQIDGIKGVISAITHS